MELISRVKDNEYYIVLHFDNYEEMKYVENLIKEQIDSKTKSYKTDNAENICIENHLMEISAKYRDKWSDMIKKSLKSTKTDKETPIHEKVTMPDISDFTTLESTPNNDFGMMWVLILCMIFLSSGNHDSYYKGMCDAYEKIFSSEKQEENMQKAREALAKLKKSLEQLNKNDIS